MNTPTITDVDGVELAPEMGALEAIEHLARCGAHVHLKDRHDQQESTTPQELDAAFMALDLMTPTQPADWPALTTINVHSSCTSVEMWSAWHQFVSVRADFAGKSVLDDGLIVTQWRYGSVEIVFLHRGQ